MGSFVSKFPTSMTKINNLAMYLECNSAVLSLKAPHYVYCYHSL